VSKLGLADPDEAIAFGRIDAANDRWYIGKGAIWDDDNDLVVVNWQAPIAAPFYTATPAEPEGLDARRLFRCTGNQIREIEDLVFRDLADAIASGRPPEPVLTDRAARRPRQCPLRRAGRHRGHDPGRPVRRDQPRPQPAPGGAGRSGHRQDGRGPAPGVVAAVQPP
jgi:hypothetical protein